MNKKFLLVLATLASFSTQAGVKVTSVDLKTNGSHGYVNVTIEGRSPDLPDVKVYGKTIEVTLTNAEAFNSIFKNINGAQLSANVLNGKAIIKAILPYVVNSNAVDLDLKNQNIEVVFPRGKVVRTEAEVTPVKGSEKSLAHKKVENTVLAKVEKTIPKEKLNEDYLNSLMKEEKNKVSGRENVSPSQVKDQKRDEVKFKQASIAKPQNPEIVPNPSSGTDSFSFAGYAAKFTVFLAMVLGLFYGIVQLLKKGVFNRGKLGFLNNSQMIQVLSTTYVAPKRSLLVVKAHNQIFLVSNSETGLQLVSEMTDTAGLIKAGEKIVTGSNFDVNLGSAEDSDEESGLKLKENINESAPMPEERGIAALTAKDIVKFSDELKKKAKKLRPIEFN